MNSVVLMLWKLWDFFYPKAVGLHYIDKKGGNIFRVALRKYRGHTLHCKHGTKISKGDWVGELHIYNLGLLNKLKATNHEVKWAIITLKEVRDSIPGLVHYLCHDPQGKKIKALVARTVLHRGAKQLGFEVQDIPVGIYSIIKIPYLRWIFTFCHPNGSQRLKYGREKLVPKYVFVTRDDFIHQYRNTQMKSPIHFKTDHPDLLFKTHDRSGSLRNEQ